MLEVNAPVVFFAPCSVFVGSAIVGFEDVLQQTPCWVGLGEPRSVILPFPVAVVVPMPVTVWVVTVGACALVVKET